MKITVTDRDGSSVVIETGGPVTVNLDSDGEIGRQEVADYFAKLGEAMDGTEFRITGSDRPDGSVSEVEAALQRAREGKAHPEKTDTGTSRNDRR